MVKEKKLTQTTLSFFVKPKSSNTESATSPHKLAPKKRNNSASETRDECLKKPKLSSATKLAVEIDSEPEVSSSSEQILSASSQISVPPASQSTLEPFIVLTRCDSPLTEVTSSTAGDDIVDLIEEEKTDISTPKVTVILEDDSKPGNDIASTVKKSEEPIKLECDVDKKDIDKHCEEIDSGLGTSDQGQQSNSTKEERAQTPSENVIDGPASPDSDSEDEELINSPDRSIMSPSSEDATTPATRRTRKCVTTSAKKKQDELRAATQLKQKQKEEEREAKRLQKLEEKARKDKEVEDKKKQKEAERLAKQKEKEEKQKERDLILAQKKAELDAKKEAERKKREEEKLKKEEERLKKEEEKRQKEEDRKQKEEERRQKDEEKRLEKQKIEDEKKRKEEARRNHLAKFFKHVKKDSPEKDTKISAEEETYTRFKSFAPKPDMRVAPLCRVEFTERDLFEKQFRNQSVDDIPYLQDIKIRSPLSNPDTWPWTEEDDVELIGREKHRVKFLQFHTDIRPAYFGTWRKVSLRVTPRRPLGLDKERFDYDVDSADEWEEEEPGESVDSGEEEDEEKDEHEFDPELREEGFLVDHNHLSDDEGGVSDNEESLAAKKTKQMIARTYGKRNRKKSKLKPAVCGTVWNTSEINHSEEHHVKHLQHFKAIIFAPLPIDFTAPVKVTSPISTDKKTSDNPNSSTKKLSKQVPDEAIPEFIKRVHGCVKGAPVIIRLFQEFWLEKTQVALAKRQLKLKIQQIAVYQKRAAYRKCCWYVNDDVLQKYSLTDLPVPNPIYKAATPNKSTQSPAAALTPVTGTHAETPGEVSQTPSAHKPSPQVDSAQKRMTDFLQPAKKKLKVDDLTVSPRCSDSNGPKPRKVALITLSDSPETPERKRKSINPSALTTKCVPTSTTSNKKTDSNTPRGKSDLNAAPRRVGITTLQTVPAQDTSSPRRVTLTTVKSPQKSNTNTEQKTPPKVKPTITPQTGKSPRRVPFSTLSSPSTGLTNVTSPIGNKCSPRRVTLTTLSTPPKSHSVELDTKAQPVRSPRRVELITIQSASSAVTSSKPEPVAAVKPTLTERSQNAQKVVLDDKQIKTGAL